MNWTRIGIVGFVGLCVWAAWPKGNDATPPRPLLIRAALKQVDDPVVILGDSIVRRASFPRAVCGRPIINAGIDGSTTSSGLDAMLTKALGGKQAAMVVISLGLNDAAIPLNTDLYRTNYFALLATLKSTTPRMAIATVTPVEAGKADSPRINNETIDGYNALLPTIVGDAGASLVTIPSMPAKYTNDGIHLNDAGYAIWTKALLEGVSEILCKGK
ncbi:SGNH/GDSL hydrolase family protein [Tardiphaga sp. P9-11]|jgi:lysophospholipase L1-like esterase|uniref:SGNH/GDSL hydrolase family protein n=1 Tax=Tardiphaga sp. P9-11 TaxID=2024614 RepID=UPI0011F1A7AC|nr:SGNH/GDSL hydrolase family protein [Tardiphaga sp. P9-11]KAA0074044.1 SGNH/GDSL hydrolase family protein [Tardiphaga sp. P9-11]